MESKMAFCLVEKRVKVRAATKVAWMGKTLVERLVIDKVLKRVVLMAVLLGR